MLDWIEPEWPAPEGVRAVITTRTGGVSLGPYASNNVAFHVGEAEAAVVRNRQYLQAALGLKQEPQWLTQVHGTQIVTATDEGLVPTADGCYSRSRGLACAVLTADCLPILLCDEHGTQIAAVHAGWRGLANGVVARAVRHFEGNAGALLAYLGPAISSAHFEVGVEVCDAFMAQARDPAHLDCIASSFKAGDRPLHYFADLYQLARAELHALGVTRVYGGEYCTYADSRRFYSYRRDGTTGRMASLIWLAEHD